MRKARTSSAGFTLIEILVALGLLMVGLTVIAGLFAVGLDQLRSSSLRSEAGDSLPQVLDDLEGRLKDRVHRQLNAYLNEWAKQQMQDEVYVAESPLPPVIQSTDALEVDGAEDLRYSFVATQVPGRPLQYLTRIEITWKIRGRGSARKLTTLYELRPSLVRRYLDKNLEYKAPAGD